MGLPVGRRNGEECDVMHNAVVVARVIEKTILKYTC